MSELKVGSKVECLNPDGSFGRGVITSIFTSKTTNKTFYQVTGDSGGVDVFTEPNIYLYKDPEPKFKVGEEVAFCKKFFDINFGTNQIFGFVGNIVNIVIEDGEVFYDIEFGNSKSIIRCKEEEVKYFKRRNR